MLSCTFSLKRKSWTYKVASLLADECMRRNGMIYIIQCGLLANRDETKLKCMKNWHNYGIHTDTYSSSSSPQFFCLMIRTVKELDNKIAW